MDIVTSFAICLCLGLALHRVLVLSNMGALGVVLALHQSTDLQQTHSRQRKTAKTATRARWLEALVRERIPSISWGRHCGQPVYACCLRLWRQSAQPARLGHPTALTVLSRCDRRIPFNREAECKLCHKQHALLSATTMSSRVIHPRFTPSRIIHSPASCGSTRAFM